MTRQFKCLVIGGEKNLLLDLKSVKLAVLRSSLATELNNSICKQRWGSSGSAGCRLSVRILRNRRTHTIPNDVSL
jgi:hypothetical protein